MSIEKMARISKRFWFENIGKDQYDVIGRLAGKNHVIGTIKERQFKRLPASGWLSTWSQDSLDLIQSYAALRAAEGGLTGPL